MRRHATHRDSSAWSPSWTPPRRARCSQRGSRRCCSDSPRPRCRPWQLCADAGVGRPVSHRVRNPAVNSYDGQPRQRDQWRRQFAAGGRAAPARSAAHRRGGGHVQARGALAVQDAPHSAPHRAARWSPHASEGKLTLTICGKREVRWRAALLLARRSRRVEVTQRWSRSLGVDRLVSYAGLKGHVRSRHGCAAGKPLLMSGAPGLAMSNIFTKR